MKLSALLLGLATAGLAAEAGAVAARIDFAIGGVMVTASDGRERLAAKGAEVDSGDTVRTNDGRVQLRFLDGAYVSLQPNTEFRIADYRFEGKTDGSERGLFGLTKGAMRTVTGLIGKVNRNAYKVTTPTATVGIRGTGGRIEVLLDGSTLVAGTSGIWTLSNPSGTLDVPAGTFGKAPAAPNQPPQQTSQGPNTAPAPLDTSPTEESSVPPPPPAPLPPLPTVVLPTTGFYTYALASASAPTYNTGGQPGSFNGSVGVLFGIPVAQLSFNFQVTMPDNTYNMSGNTTTNPGTVSFVLNNPLVSAGTCSAGGCTGHIQGTFTGATGQGMNTSYNITDPVAKKSLGGSASFTQQPAAK